MKTFSIRLSGGIIALATLTYFLACTPPSGNINQNQNTAANTNQAARALSECKVQPDPAGHAADLLKRLKDQINDSDLADNLKPDPATSTGTFIVDVQPAAGARYFEAYIKGEVRGDDNLKVLSDILNNFQGENDCMRVAYFVQDLMAPSTPGGFKWSSCEYPLHVCPNGECCPRAEPSGTPGMTPTPRPNPLSNSGAGASANANRKGNANN